MAYASFSQFLDALEQGGRTAAHHDAGRDRSRDRGMGGPRNEIAGRRQGAPLRTADDRRQSLEIPRRDQHHGLGEADGAGAAGREHRRHRAGDSAHSEGETADRSARRLEPAQAGHQAAACAAEAGQICRLPGSGASLRRNPNLERRTHESRFPSRSADPEMLAEGWRALHHFPECSHPRSGNRRAQSRDVPDAGLRRA